MKVLHSLPGRIRVDLPALKNNRECLARLSRLNDLQDLLAVFPNGRTGRMLVKYKPGILSEPEVLSFICSALNGAKEYSAHAEVGCAKDNMTGRPGQGLTEEEALERLQTYGPNILPPFKKPGFIRLITGQFDGFLAKTLIASAAVSIMAREAANAISILAIASINAFFSAYQEHNSEKAMEAISRLVEPKARVLRDGEIKVIPAPGLVPGDLVFLEQGSRVPADLLVVRAGNLCAEESSLTGESCPVEKFPSHILYMGTNICRGKAEGRVISTGTATAMGGITTTLKEERTGMTDLQRELNSVGNAFLKVSSAAALTVLSAELLRGKAPLTCLVEALSLAVSAIPEGLPTMVTIAQANGVTRLAGKGALARRLPSVENVGKTTVVCFDKTGTLTMNRQTLKYIYTGHRLWSVSETGGYHGGKISVPGFTAQDADLYPVIRCGVLCNDALINKSGIPEGDPLDVGLLSAAQNYGIDVAALKNGFTRLDEIPFDSARGFMTVICSEGEGNYQAFVKGAIDRILGLCDRILCSGEIRPLCADDRNTLEKQRDLLAGRGYRVLALAHKQLNSRSQSGCAGDLIFLGLAAFHDPPRPEAGQVLRQLRQAGIRTVIMTGDNRSTALALARTLGLADQKVKTGAQLEKVSPEDLPGAAGETGIYAQMLPEHKLTVIEALKQSGDIVVMVGDGVNDAPAVKKADIGMAMEGIGSDVTRHTADIVITAGGLTTVVQAIGQGRIVHRNIKSTLEYLLEANAAELTIAFLPLLAGLRSALPPVQMLWLNILADGLPALSLTVMRPEKDNSGLQNPGCCAGVMDKGMFAGAIGRGIVTGATGLLLLVYGQSRGDIYRARSMSMAAVVTRQIIQAWESSGRSKDKFVRLSLGATALLFLASVYLPGPARLLKMAPLGMANWLAVMAAVFASLRLDGVLALKNKGGGL